ncbi:TIGR01244 family sulfur transferase [Neisseria iguanae]|uniref:TIGR01244 family phosphatase n=1 Tax=Neisseria iguanae TaxID=90242 RepID=A0A2P7TYR8_9NEIS|nr:TIGR01244 family sulfur transferase [Neisseria iguanae]PSJ79845.1 TIGR01244 family phosphatase [Neisseria iguanae]
MAILKLSKQLYVSPQLTEQDAQVAAKLGIQTVICNRPDGEENNQPSAEQVQQWLSAQGITAFEHLPVVAPDITAADVAAFQNLLQQTDKPVLAYCRTGTRSSLLWAYHQVQNNMSVAAAKAAAAKAGIDLSNFDASLQAAAGHTSA